MNTSTFLRCLLVPGLLVLAGCDVTGPQVPKDAVLAPRAEAPATSFAQPAPEDLVTVAGLEFWPYTTQAPGAAASDPVDLVFPGVGPRSVRAALMMLDGDRTAFGFPATPPFNCTWKEAMGANQATYATAVGWTGSAIQLECGDYSPIRFHVRLFPVGGGTVGAAHFEVLISGTNEHEVLSWELAEQLVMADIVRAGILGAPPASSDPINEAPSFRTINPLVYDGLPPELKALAGNLPGSGGVGIANDGSATILTFAGEVDGERTVAKRTFVLDFDQTIPKPFCMQGPLDYLHVQGPIQFRQQVVVSGSGNYVTHFHAVGGLELTPVNPITGEVTGETLKARVAEHDRSVVTDQVTLVSTLVLQLILPASDPASGRLQASVTLGPGASDHGTIGKITCGS